MDTLSQDQVDELFDGSEPTEEAATEEEEPEVRPYDFRQPSRISGEQRRSTEALYGLVASGLEGWIRARLRESAQVIVQSLEQITYGEFVLSLSAPCSSFIYDLHDGGQQLVVDLGRDFAFFCVDRLLGGHGSPTVPDRSLSRVEQEVVRHVVDHVTDDLADAWEDHVELRPMYDRFESTPEMIQMLNREDPVLVANLEIRFGDQESLVEICLPFTAIEEHFSRGNDSSVHHAPESARAAGENRQKLESTLYRTRVPVTAKLPEFRIPVRELADLEEGTILPTGLPSDTEVELWVAGQKRFKGEPGRARKNLAVSVTEPVDPRASENSSDEVLKRVAGS